MAELPRWMAIARAMSAKFKAFSFPVIKSYSVVPLFRCSVVPLFRCSVVPLFRCSVVPLFRCPDPLFRCSVIPRFLLSLLNTAAPLVLILTVLHGSKNRGNLYSQIYC